MSPSGSTFQPTASEQRRRKQQSAAQSLLALTTAMLALPALGILSILIIRGFPGLSAEFFLEEPRNVMSAGGIFPALVGTVWLTAVALLVALPLGISAAIYLSEYAKDNWLTGLINIAIVNHLCKSSS